MIYLLATLSTLVVLNIVTTTSYQVNLLVSINTKINETISQFYWKTPTNTPTQGTGNMTVKSGNTTTNGTGIVTVKINVTSKPLTAGTKKDQQISKVKSQGRPLNCRACFPHNYTYVLDNENICQPTDISSSVEILVLISTVHPNTERRKALRETWLTAANQNQGNIRYVFLLGMTSDINRQVALETESATYKDIVQEDFIDHYNNLTLKTVMGFKWASIKCPGAKFVLKTDDDMFVNIPALKLILRKFGNALQTSVGGHCRLNDGPIRHKGYKWYVPREMYPLSQYPGYCSGTGYVTSMNVVKKVYDVSKHVPFFYLEDVYVGICVHKLGLKAMSLPGFHTMRVPIGCNYKNSIVVTSHQLDPNLLRQAWGLKCNDTIH
jgi:beta-1,3-galactosyltransferase 1